ncbi:vitronectin a [Anguilla rostrata]|uniref:vitronectin a n=1 Tax=Anguilla rostrata TaxID=7938 RepID=UPI0030D04B44
MDNPKLLAIVLLAASAAAALAAEESCLGRCENGFEAKMACQCDSMCRYYKSCCSDYESVCGSETRGDTFAFAEDDDELFNSTAPEAMQSPTQEGATPSPAQEGATPSPAQEEATPSPAQEEATPSPAKEEVTPSPAQEEATPSPVQEEATPSPVQEEATPSPAQEEAAPSPAQDDQSRIIPVVTQTASYGGATKKQLTQTPTDASKAPPTAAPVTAAPPTSKRAPDPAADPCSGLPFDSFMQLKNNSLFAFRGDYFFELDDRAVLPGYPKLIKDVWGVPGPIDAAFTRINCQGKTYIFKGNKYWRFEDGVLDDDYPRDISVGFEKIPDDVDAAFAIPATNHHGKEKVYFFKGDQYYQYEFKNQPTHEECSRMTSISPSILFTRYTDLYYDRWEDIFHLMFQGLQENHGGPRFINRDWVGIRSPVDAAMVGRLYISRRPLISRQDGPWGQGWPWGQGGPWGQGVPWGWTGPQGRGTQQRRQSRSPQWSSMADWGADLGQAYAEQYYNREIRREDQDQDRDQNWNRNRNWNQDRDQNRNRNRNQQQSGNRRQQQQYNSDDDYRYSAPLRPNLHTVDKGQPVQNVYFFKKDQYYRVDLQTKRVDYANPPYPRSIAKYWLGCSDKPGAEKR